NLRSALDHVAWSLAGTRADSFTEFPIFIDRDWFGARDGKGRPERGSGLCKLHDMPAEAQAIIESLQPYRGLHGPPEIDALWLLQRLSIEDKHRTLNLVAAGVDVRVQVRTHANTHPAYGMTGRTGYLPLEDGAEIYSVPIGPGADVQDDSSVTF